MTDLQFIITMAVIAFAILTTCVVGVIFSVLDMLKQLEEKTPDDQTPAARYEFRTIAWPYCPRPIELREFIDKGWRIINVVQCADGYMIFLEREKIKEGGK